VNAKKIYYGEETRKALKNFNVSGRKVSLHLIKALALVKLASADANYRLKKLTGIKHKAIVRACHEIIDGKMNDQFITDAIQGGAGTSINMNINEVIASRASEISKTKIHYLDDVNMSQSTNDVIPASLRLVCLQLLDDYLRELAVLEKAFSGKAKEFKDVIKVGRTHLQDAVPITLGQEFFAYASFVKRDRRRLEESKKYLLQTNLGGTAIGTGINSSKAYVKLVNKRLSQLSGYDFMPADDLVDLTQNLDSFLHLMSLLKISGLGLSKIAGDLRLMASGPRAGFSEIKLPEFQKGSSIMPGKNNPVTLEVVSQIAYEVSGNAQKASLAFLGGQLELNAMLPTIIKSILESLMILTAGVVIFTKTVGKIEANKKRCLELFNNSLAAGTILVKYVGYDKATKVIEDALSRGLSLEEKLKRDKILPVKKIKEIFSNGRLTKPEEL